MKYLHYLPAEISVFLLILSSIGCASRPDGALKLAQTAMDEAKQLQASDLAPADWKSAQKAWDDAQAALSKQRYGEAATLLATSKSRFEKARTIAKAKRDVLSKEVSTLQNTLNTRFGALKNTVETGKLTGKSKKDLSVACKDLEVVIDKFNGEVLNDKLVEARSSGQVALQKLNDLEMKLPPALRGPNY